MGQKVDQPNILLHTLSTNSESVECTEERYIYVVKVNIISRFVVCTLVKVSQSINHVLSVFWFVKFEITATYFFRFHESQKKHTQGL